MKCERARELASEALDGELTAGATGDFDRHLRDCPPCRTFYAELRESLLLLEDLPVVEVTDEFNAAVWSRIRAEEAPESVWAGWRARLDGWAERFRMTAPAWKWSPVGVAAALALFLGISSDLTGGPDGAGSVVADAADAPIPTSESATSSNPGPSPSTATVRSDGTVATTTMASVRPTEQAGDIPEAIERFLQRSESRELRLEGGTDRYRQANYSYPLRRVPDPSRGSGAGTIPVQGRRVFGPKQPDPAPRGAVLPVVQPASPGVEVIAF